MMQSLNAIVPMACVTAAGIAAMVAEAFRDPGERMPIAGLGVVGLVGAAIAAYFLWDHPTTSLDLVAADKFGLFVTWILIIAGLLSLAISGPTIDRERLPAGEYYALMLFATAAMMLMATGTGLLLIFLALEVMSLAVYGVTGIRPTSRGAAGAGVQVFLYAFEPLRGSWADIVWVIAAATMILGTVVGVAQSNVKRMLAYSSIGHGGYLLVALLAGNDVGRGAVLFYLLTYAVTNIGA